MYIRSLINIFTLAIFVSFLHCNNSFADEISYLNRIPNEQKEKILSIRNGLSEEQKKEFDRITVKAINKDKYLIEAIQHIEKAYNILENNILDDELLLELSMVESKIIEKLKKIQSSSLFDDHKKNNKKRFNWGLPE